MSGQRSHGYGTDVMRLWAAKNDTDFDQKRSKLGQTCAKLNPKKSNTIKKGARNHVLSPQKFGKTRPEISFLGDQEHRDRCMRLRQSLTMVNRGQGMGFQILGTVVDKRMLTKALAVAFSASGGLVTWLSQVGQTAEPTNDTVVNGA